MQPDLNALAVFALVAEERSFRAAADRLGVTRSAVSQTIRRLEETLGIALVQRTTRSVSLTEAGERLHAGVAPAIADMRAAIEATGSLRDARAANCGLRFRQSPNAFSSGPFLAGFAEANPEIQIDITVTDEEFDIVAEGYDAGVRLGEVIEQDMIAVPVAGDQRQLAVCSPGYRDRFGVPAHPRELAAHRCIGWRPAPKRRPISVGVRRERKRVQRRGRAGNHDQRHGADDQARRRRRRHHLRHGGELSRLRSRAESSSGPRGLLLALRRILSLLSEPQEHRTQIARACRACTTTRMVASMDWCAPVNWRSKRPTWTMAVLASWQPSCRERAAVPTCDHIRA